MRLTTKLYRTVSSHFSDYSFTEGDEFKWSPSTQTITVQFEDPNGAERLLHETAHAALGHKRYDYDVALVALERDAWQYAKVSLAPGFDVQISEEVIEDDLDTYREWMHKRSTCPECSATGVQTDQHTYRCPTCVTSWRVNTARGCELRRYKITH